MSHSSDFDAPCVSSGQYIRYYCKYEHRMRILGEIDDVHMNMSRSKLRGKVNSLSVYRYYPDEFGNTVQRILYILIWDRAKRCFKVLGDDGDITYEIVHRTDMPDECDHQEDLRNIFISRQTGPSYATPTPQ